MSDSIKAKFLESEKETTLQLWSNCALCENFHGLEFLNNFLLKRNGGNTRRCFFVNNGRMPNL